MTESNFPPLPPYPVLPERSEHRVRWNEWARSYAEQAVAAERERCAREWLELLTKSGVSDAAYAMSAAIRERE